jgi:AraC-like DNA-binding protein/mannose-6-phosphate isomerase-like protein (cupin superfamily)
VKRKNNITFIKVPDCFNITITEGTDVHHTFEDHFHNSYNIGIIRNGCAILKSGPDEKKISKGSIYFINPRVIHNLKNIGEKPVSYSVISIEETEFRQIFKSMELMFKNAIENDPLKSNHILQGIRKILDDKTLSFEKQEILADILSGFCFRKKEAGKIKKEYLEKALSYLNKNYKDEINLDDLCQIANVSLFHFIRQFRKYIGLSPVEYIIQLRIKEAQSLLQNKMKISEIALETGFFDQSHFTKYFKKHTGISPREYMKNYKIEAGQEP